ncbi:DUF5623 domain-containing protein [Advenella kashmirensis]
MSSKTITPSTLDGIKRLAKSIKNERGISHTEALGVAAEMAGYQNYNHALNVLSPAPELNQVPSKHSVYLTAYWKTRDGEGSGRETLIIALSAPWTDVITKEQLGFARALRSFDARGPDHLTNKGLCRTQSEAQEAICAAARTFSFMDATKLRPSKSYSRAYPKGLSTNAIPGSDHASVWYDRKTKRYLIADEPYEKGVENRKHEREIWAQQHGFQLVRPKWAGMYAPDIGSQLYLMADKVKGIDLQHIVTELDKLAPPMTHKVWNGESAPLKPYFVSPGSVRAVTPVEKTKAPNKPNGPRNSVRYIQSFVGTRSRPKNSVPIDVHAEIGRLLKSVLHTTFRRKGVYNRINSVRSELDEWVQREYSHDELPYEQFLALYYQDTYRPTTQSMTAIGIDKHIESLYQAKNLLCEHYLDCPSVRTLVKKVEAAVKSLETWRHLTR